MRSYRSLAAWQRAHAVAMGVLRLTSGKRSPETWALFDQLRRAAISVEANLVEGYALGTQPLFKRHIRIALGSAAEVECLMRMALEAGLVDPSSVASLQRDVHALVGLLRGLLKSPKTRGGT